jgi:hypothetical protein
MSARSVEKELSDLERSITALGIDYERFFTGDLRLPPVPAVRKVEETLRRLANLEIERASDRFRLQSIQSRFHSVKDLWEKRIAAKDTGRGTFGRAGAAAGAAAAPGPTAPAAPAAGDASGPDSVQGKRRVSFVPLFERYIDARRALGEDVSRLKYERFEELVRRQADEIRKQTGTTRLVFEVQTVEGKVRLVGRPAPAKGNG